MSEIIRKSIRVTKEDWDIIEQLALLSDMSTNAYISESAKNPVNLSINYEVIEDHTKLIMEIKKGLDLILRTGLSTGEFYESDIKNAVKVINTMIETEKKLYQELEKDRKKKNTLLKNTLKKELEKRLGK